MKGKFELFMCCLGNGVTVCNKAVMEYGDYKHIAHISDSGKINLYVSKSYIPVEDMRRIEQTAAEQRKTFLNDFLEKCYAEYQKAGIADSRGKDYIPEAVARDTRLDVEKALIELAIDILPDIPEKETLRNATTHWKYREQILDLILRLDV